MVHSCGIFLCDPLQDDLVRDLELAHELYQDSSRLILEWGVAIQPEFDDALQTFWITL